MNLPRPPDSVKPTDLAGILRSIATDMIARGFSVSVSPTAVTISTGDRTFRLVATDLDASPADGVPGGPIADLLMQTRVPVQVPKVGGGAPVSEPWEDFPVSRPGATAGPAWERERPGELEVRYGWE